MTLAAFAGPDEVWAEFEMKWDEILHSHTPRAEYVHMNELVRQIEGFDRKLGWTQENSWALVWNCLRYMQHLDKRRFRMFYCAIDLEARRRLVAETYQIPDPVDMCNDHCSEMILKWYLARYPEVIDPNTPTLYYFFDKDEPFKEPFEKKWISETDKLDRSSGDWNVWSLVAQISPVEMRKVPGIQAADILAWSVNRENTVADPYAPGKSLSYIMKAIIPSASIVWDEAKMREKFRPLIYLR